jgi:hypothetical protein
MFSFCSHKRCAEEEPTDAESSALDFETEPDEASMRCGGDVRATLVANSFLEREAERLTEAISTGFARGRIRKPPKLARN